MLTDLEVMSVMGNNDLGGTIPASLGNLQRLQVLQIARNQLTGQIPDSLSNLSKLNVLYVSENQLTGTIPSTLFTLPSVEFFFVDYKRTNAFVKFIGISELVSDSII